MLRRRRHAILAAKRTLALANGDAPGPVALPDTGITRPAVVRMEFTGSQRGAVLLSRRPSGRMPGQNNPFDKYIDADPRDVAPQAWACGGSCPARQPITPPPPAPAAPFDSLQLGLRGRSRIWRPEGRE